MRRVEVAPGVELDVIDEGWGEKGVAVLLHGFPNRRIRGATKCNHLLQLGGECSFQISGGMRVQVLLQRFLPTVATSSRTM